ncbi:MAG: hypothetical protein ACI9E1_001769 [Cryomorphaceae bacterium]|jgi:hypothetical protein
MTAQGYEQFDPEDTEVTQWLNGELTGELTIQFGNVTTAVLVKKRNNDFMIKLRLNAQDLSMKQLGFTSSILRSYQLSASWHSRGWSCIIHIGLRIAGALA